MAVEGAGLADTDLPLPLLFQRAFDVHQNADSATGAQLQQALRWLQLSAHKVDTLGLFSPNEQAEDVATADLKYLLVPYLLAEAQSRDSTQDKALHLQRLEEAASSLRTFQRRCEQYGLLAGAPLAEEQLDAYVDGQVSSASSADPAARRAQKIARFRLEQAARARLDALRTQVHRQKRLRELEGDMAEGASAPGVDEDAEREAWLAQMHLAALRSHDMLDLLQQEAQLLRRARALPDQATNGRPPGDSGPPANVMEALRKAAAGLAAAGGPQQGERERARAGVFKPSHALPTVTLAQQMRGWQAEREMAAARAAAEAQAAAEAAQRAQRGADVYGEQETLRQRAWDDWKDDHPAGAGNSKLRPTA